MISKTLIFILLFFNLSIVNAQVGRFRCENLATRILNNNDKWDEWSDWKPCNYLITINVESQRITIYSNSLFTYDMIENKGKTYDKEGNPIYTFMCLDEDLKKCELTLYYNPEVGNYLIVSYSNFELMYKVKIIKN
jgi:hypothetical protein